MGQDLELEFEKYCVVDGSPKTVLPSPRHSKVEKRKVRDKPKCGNEVLIKNKDFTEISFHCYRSASCRAVPSRLESNEVLKRGSVYQSSNERTKMMKGRETEGRRKIEFSRSSATALSFEIVDSLCSSDEDSSLVEQINRSSVMLLSSQSSTFSKTLQQDFLDSTENSKLRCDPAVTFHKSLSARFALPHLPTKLESDSSKPISPKTRFSPIRKMFDPFIKSKSQKSPLGSATGPDEATSTELVSMSRNMTQQKSLLHDFSNTVQNNEFVKKDSCISTVSNSPALLSGLLKLENKHGVPFFEFLVNNPGDVLVANTWKVGNGFNWVYTFHTAHNRRKSNVSGWGSKDSNKESTMVGQMQVSCYLCTELIDARAFDNSMVTEFVLYDITRPRKSVGVMKEISSGETYELNEVADQTKLKSRPKEVFENVRNDKSTPCPLAVADLHPDLEIAAVVIQFPFEKRESLKFKRGDMKNDVLLNLSGVEQKMKPVCDCLSPAKVNVVTPSGNHGSPTAESRGPSPLLDRWRLGGGCDCGGWDMGCPLVVFGNPNVNFDEDHPLMENQQPVKLFVQGNKENTPALTMKVSKEGQYAVDFHAQLTSLQAFSICVAILHSTEVSIAVGQDRDRQLLQCDSLRVFIEDEVKHLIEVVAEEEKRRPSKTVEETPPSFLLNPPFSPMSRA